MKSARGVYYDLNESDYFTSLKINNETIKFYFSSMFNANRFEKKLVEYIHNENLKLSFMYGIDIDATKLFALVLYKKLEKRGFRVEINEQKIDSNLTLHIV